MRDSAGLSIGTTSKRPRELIDLKAKKSARVKRVTKELLLSFGGIGLVQRGLSSTLSACRARARAAR